LHGICSVRWPTCAPYEGLTRWTLTLGTLMAAGWLVRTLTDRLRECEQHLRFGIEQSSLGSATVGLDGIILDANAACAAFLGLPAADLVGTPIDRFRHPDDPGMAPLIRDEAVRTGSGSHRYELRLARADGTPRWFAVTSSVVRDERRRPLHLFAQIDDVTERHQRHNRQDAVTRLARAALDGAGSGDLAERAARLIGEGLGLPRRPASWSRSETGSPPRPVVMPPAGSASPDGPCPSRSTSPPVSSGPRSCSARSSAHWPIRASRPTGW
jgi:PAS domain S-box-containing protein